MPIRVTDVVVDERGLLVKGTIDPSGGSIIPPLFLNGVPPLFLNGWANAMAADADPDPVPDLERTFGTEPLIGWRVWKLASYRFLDGRVEPRLAPISGGPLWHPRERATAVCSLRGARLVTIGSGSTSLAAHEAPAPDCACGFWALRNRGEAEQLAKSQSAPCVFGEVALWGRVLEFERGLRAQYAYPQLLYGYAQKSEDIVREVGELYGIETRIVVGPPDQGDLLNALTETMTKQILEMAASLKATPLATQAGMLAARELQASLGTPLPVDTQLAAFAGAGLQVVDAYLRAAEAQHATDIVERTLMEARVKMRRVGRFRIDFPNGGRYEAVAAPDPEQMMAHFRGRRPDVVDLPPGCHGLRTYLKAHGVHVMP